MGKVKKEITLGGKPLFGGVVGGPPPVSLRAVQYLDKLPDGIVLSGPELAQAIHCTENTLQHRRHYGWLKDYRARIGIRLVWGSKHTIAEAKRQAREMGILCES